MRPNDRILRGLGVSFVAEKGGISEYRLNANGLKIILAPDPSARVVCVVQHVHVGSRHEGAGNTGYSHLLEHMLFKGTPANPNGSGHSYDDFMKRLGGVYNATTWLDRTNYFAKIPAHFLGAYLAYEADRLRNAIITDEDLKTEMPVVVDEFDIGENDPDEVTEKLLYATVFTEHSYKISTIGARSEVMKVTAAALRERLYDVYYYPNNTSLIIVGGFDVAEALGLVVQHYAGIAPSPRPIPVPYTVEPPQFGERRFVINKTGDLPRVMMGFHVPEADHEDTHALNALAQILGGTPSSRLFRKLVNSGLCSVAYSSKMDTHDPGMFKVYAKLTPGTKPEKVERIILREIARMANTLVTKTEWARAKTLNRAGTVLAKANRLGWAQQISENEACADWKWGVDYDDAFEAVTPERIREVAQKYLSQDNRTVGYFIPKNDGATVPSEPQTEPAPAPAPQDGNGSGSTSGDSTSGGASSFASQVKEHSLSNGLKVLLMPTGSDGAFGVSFMTRAGSSDAAPDKRVTASVVAEMLTEGSKKFSKDRIADLASEMQLDLTFVPGAFYTSLGKRGGVHVVPSDMPRFLDLLADVVRNPLFAQKELDLLKTKTAAELEEAGQDPNTRAMIALTQAVYPEGAAHRKDSIEAIEAQVAGITADDLRSYHTKNWSPKGTVLVVVGGFEEKDMLAVIESKFGSWTGEDRPAPQAVPTSTPAANARAINIDIDGKDNLTILVGLTVDLSVTSADWAAATLANKALGGDTLTSRLGKEIREKRGLTYGITSNFRDATVNGGLWIIGMTTNGGKLKQAVPLIGQVTTEYSRNGIDEQELAAEREAMVNAFSMQLDAPMQIASTIAQHVVSGRGVAAMDAYEARITGLTKADIDAAIRKYFRVDDAVTVIAGTLPK